LQASLVKSAARELGADAVGIARAEPVTRAEFFQQWLAGGLAGDMDYLRRRSRERYDPRELFPGAQSVIVVGLNYWPASDTRTQQRGPLKVARYAWGEDYHRVLRRLLRRLRVQLRRWVPDLRGRICVDTAPFMDKYWAQMAGIGWQGKHTNVVSREFGSWLLIGSLVVDAAVDRYDEPHRDFCGSCTACLDACPTKAFPSPYVLDATRCISYWTIESKAAQFPREIAANLESWVFGCDICLEVCPWNKFARPLETPELVRREGIATLESCAVCEMTDTEFGRLFERSPVLRPGLDGLRRNISAAQE